MGKMSCVTGYNVVVPFGSGSLRELGGNHWGFGLGERRILRQLRIWNKLQEEIYETRESHEYIVLTST